MATVTPLAADHEGLGPLASRYVDVDALEWESTRFPGVTMKRLMEDAETGMLTTLVRMEPGAGLPDHEHVEIEQTWVLEGSLVDSEGAATVGNFVWRPGGSRHAVVAPEGALLLSFFMKPNRFFDREEKQIGWEVGQHAGDE